MREDKCCRHIFACLVASIAKHDALVTGTLLLFGLTDNTLVDVARLLVNGRNHTTRIAIETILTLGITNAIDDSASHLLHIDVCFGTHLTGNHNQSCGTKCLASYLCLVVVTQKFIENSVGNLVGNFIGMSLRNRLGCK